MGSPHTNGGDPYYIRPNRVYCLPLRWAVSPQPIILIPVFLTTCHRYRTIADRLLGLKLVPSRSIARRSVSYEFMNRQMVWHAFTVRTSPV